MKSTLTLFAALVLAALPTLANAFPIRVDFQIYRCFAGWPADQEPIPELGWGYFIFDSGVFQGPEEAWNIETVSGPCTSLLQALSIDYMDHHWGLQDAETVGLRWNYDIPDERLTSADWGPFSMWELKGADWRLPGMDQGTIGSLNGEDVNVWWDVTLPETQVAMPEPPSLLLFGLGLTALAAGGRRIGRV
jgi:hypothetical protein